MILPSPKNASDWNALDLEAFNIKIKTVDATDFFNIPELPPPESTASSVILNNSTEPKTCTLTDSLFFFHLSRAGQRDAQYSADLAGFILRMMNYEKRDRAVATSTRMEFYMCDRFVESAPGPCLTKTSRCLLLVESGKLPGDPVSVYYAQPVLIARAIAAFNHSHMDRLGKVGGSEQTFLGIIMGAGTSPEFYKIKINDSLLAHIACGQCPATPTVVERCLPPVEDIAGYLKFGLQILEYRRAALQCFEAFKALLP